MLERFEKEGSFDGFDDIEAICLLLDLAGCRGNKTELSENLLDEFGSLKGVLEAREEQLIKMEGISRKTAAMIRVIVPFTKKWEQLSMKDHTKIANSEDAEAYCKSLLMGYRHEVFYVICLNSQCKVIGQRKISDGSINEVNAYPRIVLETALNYNAINVILCHNHPGGNLRPSAEDIGSTKQLQRLLYGVGINVLDHILVCDTEAYSMIRHGDIDYPRRAY